MTQTNRDGANRGGGGRRQWQSHQRRRHVVAARLLRPPNRRRPRPADIQGDTRPDRRALLAGPNVKLAATTTLPEPPTLTGEDIAVLAAFRTWALADVLTPGRESAGAAVLLSSEPAGCEGGCATPAVRDRVTGVWRHLTDLSRCQRQLAPPNGCAEQ